MDTGCLMVSGAYTCVSFEGTVVNTKVYRKTLIYPLWLWGRYEKLISQRRKEGRVEKKYAMQCAHRAHGIEPRDLLRARQDSGFRFVRKPFCVYLGLGDYAITTFHDYGDNLCTVL